MENLVDGKPGEHMIMQSSYQLGRVTDENAYQDDEEV